MRCEVTQGCWIRLKIPVEQVKQVIARYHLANQVKPLSRCLRCNHVLVPVNKQDILHRLEPLTIQFHETFRICPDCGQIYWSGSHTEHMQKLIDEILTTK
jgi:uncharacterized protein